MEEGRQAGESEINLWSLLAFRRLPPRVINGESKPRQTSYSAKGEAIAARRGPARSLGCRGAGFPPAGWNLPAIPPFALKQWRGLH